MTTRFKIVHEFNCSPETLWTLIENEEMDQKMSAAGDATVEWLDSEHGDVITIHKRVNMQRDLPGAIKRAIGGDDVGYELKASRESDEDTQTWTIEPLVLAGKVSCSGTTTVEETSAGCRRIIAGTVNIKVPLIGGKMEKLLIEGVEESYNNGARVLEDHIAAT